MEEITEIEVLVLVEEALEALEEIKMDYMEVMAA